MTISISQLNPAEANRFVSQHHVHTPTAGGKELVTLTGIVLVNMKGKEGGWYRDELSLLLRFPDILPPGKQLSVEQWAPFLTINAIYNQNQAVNAGWALDEFSGPKRCKVVNGGPLGLSAQIAVSDRDGLLYRVAYHLTLLGTVVDPTQSPVR